MDIRSHIGGGDVLIAVAGSSGLGRVAGIPAARPGALLAALTATPERHVALLVPRHAATAARQQAHVAIAGRPELRVCVLPLDHHALTLTVIGATVLELEGPGRGWTDPGEAVQLLQQSAARSRSFVWYPRVLSLSDPAATWRQRVRSILGARGFFTELGSRTGLEPGRAGVSPRPDEVWYCAGPPPRLLQAQLGGQTWRALPVATEPSTPYATGTSVELTGLVQPPHPPITTGRCPSCSVRRTAGGCAFCGSGPRPWATARGHAESRSKVLSEGGATR